MNHVRRAMMAFAALLLIGATPGGEQWTPAWTASMFKASGNNRNLVVENATISFPVRVGAGGSHVRVRLSNEFGPAALRIGAASIRLANGKSVPVTFHSSQSAEVPARGAITSDAAQLAVEPFDVIEVSLYLPGTVQLDTIHAAPGAKTRISPPGDHSGLPFAPAATSNSRPLLAGVDVLTDQPRPVVVAYGDSITDNAGCALDAVPICRWSDVLGRRLAAAGKPHVVVTQAIAGNRVISVGTGPSAVDRFERDVLALPGVTHVVMLEGVNDIGGSGRVRGDGTRSPTITYEQLVEGYRTIIARAHARKIKVIGLTILPYQGAGYYTEAGDAMRMRINDWIRTSGEFDAVFDMAKVVADPGNPSQLDPALHRGDHLHPNGAGETRMGEAIPLNLFP